MVLKTCKSLLFSSLTPKYLFALLLGILACSRKEAQKAAPRHQEISATPAKTPVVEKARTPSIKRDLSSIAPKAPVMPDKYRAPVTPLGQKISMPSNGRALSLPEVQSLLADKQMRENQINAQNAALVGKAKPPVMPKLELEIPNPFKEPPPIPMPKLCATGKACN